MTKTMTQEKATQAQQAWFTETPERRALAEDYINDFGGDFDTLTWTDAYEMTRMIACAEQRAALKATTPINVYGTGATDSRAPDNDEYLEAHER